MQRPHKAVMEEMTKYHSDDYIKFLRTIRPDNMSEYTKQMQRCKYVWGSLPEPGTSYKRVKAVGKTWNEVHSGP